MKIRVTEKNYAMVMGRINKFLSKPTKRYLGLKKVQTGVKEVKIDDMTMHMPVYEERDCYVPFIGKCEEHWRRKEMRNKPAAERNWDDNHIIHTTLMAVSDDYETNCIPIMAGFVIDITGDRMVIKENDILHYMKGIDGKMTSYKMRDKSDYVYFYHMPYSEDDIKERQVHAMWCGYEGVTDGYYCGGSFHDFYSNDYKASEALDTMREIQDLFQEMLESEFNRDDTELSREAEICETTVKVFCNPSAYKNGVAKQEDNMYILIDGEKYYDIMDAVLHLVRDDEDFEDYDASYDDYDYWD